eukprot:SAG11_NODE_1794_length_4249_cov_2.419036_2_plen_41_part_00
MRHLWKNLSKILEKCVSEKATIKIKPTSTTARRSTFKTLV